MTEQQPSEPVRIPMMVLTGVMRPPPTRIGSLGPVNFGRTIPLVDLLAGGAGALLGMIIGIVILRDPLRGILYGGLFGAIAGIGAVNWSPLPGESLARWLGIRALSTRQAKVMMNGRTARVYIGIAPVSRVAAGKMHLCAGAVPVAEGAYDDRGVPTVSHLHGTVSGAGLQAGEVPLAADPQRQRKKSRRGQPGSSPTGVNGGPAHSLPQQPKGRPLT